MFTVLAFFFSGTDLGDRYSWEVSNNLLLLLLQNLLLIISLKYQACAFCVLVVNLATWLIVVM